MSYVAIAALIYLDKSAFQLVQRPATMLFQFKAVGTVITGFKAECLRVLLDISQTSCTKLTSFECQGTLAAYALTVTLQLAGELSERKIMLPLCYLCYDQRAHLFLAVDERPILEQPTNYHVR